MLLVRVSCMVVPVSAAMPSVLNKLTLRDFEAFAIGSDQWCSEEIM